MLTTDTFKPALYEGKGQVEIRGEKISFHTVSEDNVIYDEEGKAIASIFSFSYFRDDVEDRASRPVIFAFNGGPGTSSCMVHVGFLAPMRLAYKDCVDDMTGLPPYELVNNGQCLLDIADVVLVDPVSTGFGLLLDEQKADRFFGVEEDAEAFLIFAQRWLQKYDRMLSPKYIIGESYGCTRASVAAGIAARGSKDRSYDIAFDGIVFIGNTVTTGKYFNREVPAEHAVLALPTYAAINWYQNTDRSVPLAEWVTEARAFADSDYVMALYRGSNLSKEERESVKAKLMHYTGVSSRYLDERCLRIDDETFRCEVIREKGKAVSRLDARMTRPLYEPFTDELEYGPATDASRGKYNPYFLAALVSGLFPMLGIKSPDRPYRSSAMLYKNWNKEAELTTAQHLYNAMWRTPGMRSFFANGYYDMATEIGVAWYMLSHANLPQDRVSIKGYPSGHMIYIGEDNIRQLTDDIRRFINGENPGKEGNS